MIKNKVVALADGRKVVVGEISVQQILDILPDQKKEQDENPAGGEQGSSAGQFAGAGELLRECCGLSVAELARLKPSELELLWNSFREVNAFFFRAISWAGLDVRLGEMLGTLADGFGEMLVDSLKEDIKTPLVTDGPPSSTPGESASESEAIA